MDFSSYLEHNVLVHQVDIHYFFLLNPYLHLYVLAFIMPFSAYYLLDKVLEGSFWILCWMWFRIMKLSSFQRNWQSTHQREQNRHLVTKMLTNISNSASEFDVFRLISNLIIVAYARYWNISRTERHYYLFIWIIVPIFVHWIWLCNCGNIKTKASYDGF